MRRWLFAACRLLARVAPDSFSLCERIGFFYVVITGLNLAPSRFLSRGGNTSWKECWNETSLTQTLFSMLHVAKLSVLMALVCVPCSSYAHHAPGKKATVSIYKVLVRPGWESNSRPTSTKFCLHACCASRGMWLRRRVTPPLTRCVR